MPTDPTTTAAGRRKRPAKMGVDDRDAAIAALKQPPAVVPPAPAAPITVNLETLLRRLPPDALSRSAQETVDELLSKANEPLTVHQRKRFLAAAERALRVRREILTLAAFASGHRSENGGRSCRECHKPFPCPDLLRAAGPALDAVAELKA